jgi:hypothetical protein
LEIEFYLEFEKFFNKVYSMYLENNDLDLLEVLRDLMKIVTIKDISFREIRDENGVTGLHFYVDKESSRPHSSFFMNLPSHIHELRCEIGKRQREIERGQHKQEPTNSSNNTSNNIEECVNCENVSTDTTVSNIDNNTIVSLTSPNITNERLLKVPPHRLNIFKILTCKFLKGKTLINKYTLVEGVVKYFHITEHNSLSFKLCIDKKTTRWNIDNVYLKISESEKIFVIDYIEKFFSIKWPEPISNVVRTTSNNEYRKCVSFDTVEDVPESFIKTCDINIFELYKKCGMNNFLKGETVYHKTLNKEATVNRNQIRSGRILYFEVREKGKRESNWSHSSCEIIDKKTNERISISDYIKKYIH